jgi:geranylgeranyl pyrophosphate synthase
MNMKDSAPSLDDLRAKIDAELISLPPAAKIPLFYDPIYYVNTLGGKKLRPLLTIICGLTVGGMVQNLIPASVAIELLHNFSLVHDDIMDNDETRRGKPTVHVKWDLATAVLAGDGLLGLAYRKLLNTPNRQDNHLVSLFTDAMLDICEGQALDKTFETADVVTEADYMTMIGKKTATLIRLSCQIGGIIGGGDENQVEALASYGFQMGLGFQIQDDLLDILADEKKLGKKVGSDFAMNKKTIATIKLTEMVDTKSFTNLTLSDFRHILTSHGIFEHIKKSVNNYFERARRFLNIIPDSHAKNLLLDLTDTIQSREM